MSYGSSWSALLIFASSLEISLIIAKSSLKPISRISLANPRRYCLANSLPFGKIVMYIWKNNAYPFQLEHIHQVLLHLVPWDLLLHHIIGAYRRKTRSPYRSSSWLWIFHKESSLFESGWIWCSPFYQNSLDFFHFWATSIQPNLQFRFHLCERNKMNIFLFKI